MIHYFPVEEYYIKLIDNPAPVIHPPFTVPLCVLPLYKAELDKMIVDGKKKVKLCIDHKILIRIYITMVYQLKKYIITSWLEKIFPLLIP